LPEQASAADQPVNPLEAAAPTKKTRYSARAREPKKLKGSGAPGDALAPAPPDAAEVADRQTQSAPLGLSGTTPQSKKKKKASETTAEKTRMSQQKKNQTDNGPKPVQHAYADSAGAGSARARTRAGCAPRRNQLSNRNSSFQISTA
jgi:peptidyl-prolyl cis-trans isomerase SurA